MTASHPVIRKMTTTFKLCAMASAIVSAGLISSQALAATPAGTLVIGKAADPQTLDPAITIDNNDWTVTYPAYQRLIRYKVVGGKGTTQVEGDLASGWTSSADGLTWEFKLKKGQKFDDGSAVTADAVKYSFERMLKAGQGPSEAFPSDMKVDVSSPDTVKFTLTKPYSPFLYTLANNGASIVNPAVVEKQGTAYLAKATAGSGPFRLVSWQKGQSLILEPNPYYAGTKPSLKQVVVKIIGDASSRRLQLENGDLDVAEDLPEDQLASISKKPGVTVAAFPSLRVTYLYLNNKKGPMSDVNMRRAISYATDYSGIIKGVLKGNAKQMRGAIPEGMWGFDPKAMQYSLNLAKAKQLIDGSTGKGATLNFVYSSKDPNWEPIAISTQATLGALGVKVKLENLANATMRERVGKGDYDIAIGNWSPDFADPYMFMNYWFDSEKEGLPGNRSYYNNPTVDKLVRQAASLTDQKERTKLYQQAQKIVINEAGYVYLFQKNYQVGLRANVKGFAFNPMLESVFNIDTMVKR
ncbi:ABC transporter substrate-binding protein [Leeia oryzae]|uniref:ABC transporter substrate-binding protein n=1 Tax=Leeia oryzae TaxID=356662 RepID=UPI00036899DC|nr:ABC transporter substrate-binding protein [Leeia oryzae]